MLAPITWLGHASVRIAGDQVICIDPWKLRHAQPADLVLITHPHHDHCSPQDVQSICTEGTILVGTPDCKAKLRRELHAVSPGDSLTFGAVTIEAVPAYNLGRAFHPRANGWVGYVITTGGVRVYHAGDTDFIPEMGDIRADVALLPVGGTYTMDARQAAQAADLIAPKLAIPIHFGDIAGTSLDAAQFAQLCRCEVRILEPEE